jgi:hypothetical protein
MVKSSQANMQQINISGVGQIKTTDLEGTWVRTDIPIQGIARVVVDTVDSGLLVRIASCDGAGLSDWGAIPADAVYAASPDANSGVAFTASYDGSFMKVDLHANLSKGLLIIASMTRYIDGRRGVFAREFFRKSQGLSAQS